MRENDIYLIHISYEDEILFDSIELSKKDFYEVLKKMKILKLKKIKSKIPVINIVSPDYENGEKVGVSYYFDFNNICFSLLHMFKRL